MISTMLPKKLVLFFLILVALMIIQLFLISLKSTKKLNQEPMFRSYHVNFTGRTRTIAQNTHFLQNKVLAQWTSIKTLSTKFTTHLSANPKVFTSITSSHSVKNQATASPTAKEVEAFTSKQQAERTKFQNRHFLRNQVPATRTSITVLSTKSTVHLSTKPKVPASFTSSDVIKDQSTTQAQEPAKFTSEQQMERLNDQATKNRFHPDSKMLFISEFDKSGEVKTVDVLLIILTYHKYFHRRENIRKTWLATCSRHEKIACWFFTDSLEAITDPTDRERILKEQKI